jgi:hypothetical protein
MSTKAQEKYDSFLRADTGFSFAEYLRISVPQIEYRRRLCRYVRRSYNQETIEGDWCTTKKAAKASYKSKLAQRSEVSKALSKMRPE